MITNTISDGFQTRQEFHFSTIRENWQLQPNASVFPDSKYLKLPTIISTALILKLVELSESTKYKRHLGHQLLETSHILRREKSSTHVLDELDVQNAINDSRRMNLVLGAYARRRSSSKSSSSAVSGSSSGTPTPPPTSTNALVNWKTPRSAALQAAFALEATSPRRPSVGETSVGSHTRRLSQPSAKIRTKRKQSPSILETGDVRRTNRVCMARDSEPTEKWTRSDCAPRNEEIGAIRCQQPRENMTIETHSTLEPSARTMQIASPDPMLPETSTKLPSVTSLLRYVDARKAYADQLKVFERAIQPAHVPVPTSDQLGDMQDLEILQCELAEAEADLRVARLRAVIARCSSPTSTGSRTSGTDTLAVGSPNQSSPSGGSTPSTQAR